jgi:3-deoxy-D-manno-octulosonate 8-phosphate phosphatase (KDO 8-P phosphatase)
MSDPPRSEEPGSGTPAREPEVGPSARSGRTGAGTRPRDLVRELIEQTPGVSPTETPEPETRPLVHGPIEGPVRILFLDLDGTLTDGVIAFSTQGDARNFWIRDGIGLRWVSESGILPVVISGRDSKAAVMRMQDLDLEHYFGVQDKVGTAQRVLERAKATWEQCVMVGDDLPDVALMKRVGWPIAVADAVPEVKAIARTVTSARAGYGAVREVAELVLRHNGAWQQVLEKYGAS